MNLLLQHWSGPLGELQAASIANMRAYATRMGAVHEFLSGSVFRSGLSPYAQKLIMLMQAFDVYEIVVMVDCDQFAVTGLADSIFEESGYGWHHDTAHPRVCRAYPKLSSQTGVFLGGAVYRLPLALRQRLRAEIDLAELAQLDTPTGGWDEGMVHRLMVRARVPVENAYFSKRWCHGSCEPRPETGAFIHIRPRPARDKLANYHALRDQGIIA